MKVGLYGGSFNPIHTGHIQLAQHLLQQGWVDEVWMEVSPQNPLKKRADLAEDSIRLALATKATKKITGIRIDDTEMHLPRPSYMWNTLQALKQAHPEHTFHLLIGADNWEVFPKWYNYQEIIENFPILIYPREGYEIKVETLPETVKLLNLPLFPISSTMIREKLKKGESIKGLVPEEIEEEVKTYYSTQ